MNLADIEYSDLNCVFKKAIGCHSKIYMKYKTKQMELQKKVDDFKQLSEYVNSPNLLKDVESSISVLIDSKRAPILYLYEGVDERNFISANEAPPGAL